MTASRRRAVQLDPLTVSHMVSRERDIQYQAKRRAATDRLEKKRAEEAADHIAKIERLKTSRDKQLYKETIRDINRTVKVLTRAELDAKKRAKPGAVRTANSVLPGNATDTPGSMSATPPASTNINTDLGAVCRACNSHKKREGIYAWRVQAKIRERFRAQLARFHSLPRQTQTDITHRVEQWTPSRTQPVLRAVENTAHGPTANTDQNIPPENVLVHNMYHYIGASSTVFALLPENMQLDSCVICLMQFNTSDYVVALTCGKKQGHVFHTQCIMAWALRGLATKHEATCPLCRAAIKIQ